jgi:hypothetical protein
MDMPSFRCFNNFRYRIFDLLSSSEYGAEAVNRAAHPLERRDKRGTAGLALVAAALLTLRQDSKT